MFPLAVLLAVLALGLNTNALQLNSYNTYAGSKCEGSPTSAVPLTVPECVSAGGSSAKFSCGKYQLWAQEKCPSSAPLMDMDLSTCIPAGGTSYKFGCSDFNNLVKVQFRYGSCQAQYAYEVYVELNKCTPVSGQAYSGATAPSINNQYSYKVTQSGSTYVVNYYYTTDCSGTAAVFSPVASGECATTGNGVGQSATSQQSATVFAVAGSAASSVVAGWATVAVAVIMAMVM
ncbi:hypothetical protein BASA81_017374 [Batrachochytrium salamandrivorans]|nr:hypothetical protein BASA81_017374 [Batrachochytrium salamandrivorans]